MELWHAHGKKRLRAVVRQFLGNNFHDWPMIWFCHCSPFPAYQIATTISVYYIFGSKTLRMFTLRWGSNRLRKSRFRTRNASLRLTSGQQVSTIQTTWLLNIHVALSCLGNKIVRSVEATIHEHWQFILDALRHPQPVKVHQVRCHVVVSASICWQFSSG